MDDSDHLHNGIVSFVYIGLAAIVFMNLWRLVAAKAVTAGSPTVATIGRAAGGLVQFGG